MCCTPSSVIFHSTQCYLTGGRVTKTIISSGLYQRPLLTFLSVKTSSWTWDQLWKFLDLNLPVVPSYKPFQQEQVGGRLCKTWRTDWTESTYAEYRCNSPSPSSLALPSFCGVKQSYHQPQDQVLISSLSLSAAPLGQTVWGVSVALFPGLHSYVEWCQVDVWRRGTSGELQC